MEGGIHESTMLLLNYFTNLNRLSSSITEILLLSLIIKGHYPWEKFADLMNLSRMQFYRVVQTLENKGLIANKRVAVNLTPKDTNWYILLRPDDIKKFGLRGALYLSYQLSWNGGSIGDTEATQRITNISERSIQRYKKMFEDHGYIVDGLLSESNCRKGGIKMTNAQLNGKKNKENIKKIAKLKNKPALNHGEITEAFHIFCAMYNYPKVTTPLKSHVAAAFNIQRTLQLHKSQIKLYELLERLVMYWENIDRPKPYLPTLKCLPMFYEDLMAIGSREGGFKTTQPRRLG